MKFAPISPKSMLTTTAAMSPYLMFLPAMETPDREHIRTFKGRKHRGSFVMLDNGLSEDKLPSEPAPLIALTHELRPNELIVPDYLEDCETTIEAAKRWSASAMLNDDFPNVRLMAVAQGRNLEEYMSCIYAFLGTPGIHTIGLSKYFQKCTGLPRLALLEEIHRHKLYQRDVEWHLLGLSERLKVLSRIALEFPWLRGIDTCYPILAAMMEIDIDEDQTIVTSPPDFFNAEVTTYAKHKGDAAGQNVWRLFHKNFLTFSDVVRGRWHNGPT